MKKLTICALLLVLAFSTAALADTVIVPGALTASSSLTAAGGDYSGSLTFNNLTGTDEIVIAWSLNLFGGSTVITSAQFDAPLVSGWEIFYGVVPGNNGSPCNENGGGAGTICADGYTNRAIPFTPGVIPGNGSLTFFFSGHYTGDVNLDNHLQANGCLSNDYDVNEHTTGGPHPKTTYSVDCTGTKWAYSSPLGGTTTPEPATLTLLGAGLLGLAGLVRRKK